MTGLYTFTIETSRWPSRNGLLRTTYRYHVWSPSGLEVVVSRWRTSRQYAQDHAKRVTSIFNAPAVPPP